MEAMLAEKHGIKSGLLADLNGGAESARIELKKSYRVGVIVDLASEASDLDFTVRQHDAAAAGNSKDLVMETKYFVKAGAATSFTKKDINTANVVDSDLAGVAGVVVIEIMAEELDVENGFNHISIAFVQGATARLCAVEYVAHEMIRKPAFLEEL